MPFLPPGQWHCTYGMTQGGIVLERVFHDSFSLARDIRVVRVWVDTEYPDRSDGRNRRNFVLNDHDLQALEGGKITVLDQSRESELINPNEFFNGYHNQIGLHAAYRSQELLTGTANACQMDVEQRFLFSDYGRNPAHEPGGVLDACRLFPLLSFFFPSVRNTSQPYPKYFRADYRLDVGLDNIFELDLVNASWWANTRRALSTARARGADRVTNKAAIFRDSETLPSVFLTAGRVVSASQGVEDLFAAVEKPLQFEISSRGLVNGSMPPRVTREHTWDNVHIWPAVRSAASNGVSTPGAFHAFHCHWRWGAVTGDPNTAEPMLLVLPSPLPQAGQRQFTGVGWSVSEGGPLVDPNIANQNLSFAITKSDQPAWEASRNPSERDFFELFSGQRSTPEEVSSGDDLVLWLSFEVYRTDEQLTEPWFGDLFVNGFYFAHNRDQTPFAARQAGAYTEAAVPTPRRQWQRFAR